MKSIKELVQQKKQKIKEFTGGRKFVKRAELEEHERREAQAKRARSSSDAVLASSHAPPPVPAAADAPLERLDSVAQAESLEIPDHEVKRRLRHLGHPITLFGEDSVDRKRRLLRAEAALDIGDEDVGGADRANVLLTIQKEDRLKAEQTARAPSSGGERPAQDVQEGPGASSTDLIQGAEEQGLMHQFQEAAERLRHKLALDKCKALPARQRILETLQLYMREWREDLDARSDEAKHTTTGLQTTQGFRQTEKAFEVLFARLCDNDIHSEIQTCLTMIIDALEQRNYLRANEIYLQLSIGNQQWPIGVTSIGIHERKAREKLSFYANEKSQAHIMNDEATRKYLHGIGRLIKAVQGLRPTDPSRSVNFNAVEHPGLGVKCASNLKRLRALLEAGDTWQEQGLEAAPHFLDHRGKVAVPRTWGNMLRSKQATGDAPTEG